MTENTELLSSAEAARYLGIQPHTLSVWRCEKRYQLPYLKIGSRVFYAKADLDRWLESRRREG